MRIYQLLLIGVFGAYQTYALAAMDNWAAAAVLGVALPCFGISRSIQLRKGDEKLAKAGDFVVALVFTAQLGVTMLIGLP